MEAGGWGGRRRQGDLEEMKRDRKPDEKEQRRFRIHGVSVGLSGEILAGP